MSLDHVLSSLGLSRRDPNSLEARLEDLQHQIRHVGRKLSQQAGHSADDWSEHLSDFGRQAARQSKYFAEFAGDQASRSARAIRRDPVPAIAVIGTVLLVASLLRR